MTATDQCFHIDSQHGSNMHKPKTGNAKQALLAKHGQSAIKTKKPQAIYLETLSEAAKSKNNHVKFAEAKIGSMVIMKITQNLWMFSGYVLNTMPSITNN